MENLILKSFILATAATMCVSAQYEPNRPLEPFPVNNHPLFDVAPTGIKLNVQFRYRTQPLDGQSSKLIRTLQVDSVVTITTGNLNRSNGGCAKNRGCTVDRNEGLSNLGNARQDNLIGLEAIHVNLQLAVDHSIELASIFRGSSFSNLKSAAARRFLAMCRRIRCCATPFQLTR